MAQPQAWLFSSSHTLILPQTSFFLRTLTPPHHLHSRFAILQPLRTNNANFNPWKFGEEEDDDTVLEQPRRKRRRSRGRSRRVSWERRWWSDDARVEGGILKQLVDELWIFKVFRAYGLFLPVILLSLLLATGPKAFLMGSGVPFGLSLLVFAFNKLSEWLDFSPNPKPKRRPKRSAFRRRGDTSMEYEDRQAREAEQVNKQSKRGSYQSRVNSFGGWDELVTENEMERTEEPLNMKARLEMMIEKKDKRELPLLLRLLVGFFPFLG